MFIGDSADVARVMGINVETTKITLHGNGRDRGLCWIVANPRN
jgi:hypothetical protein